MLKSYLRKIFEVGKTGDAREESYYSTLADLLSSYAESINKKNIHITTPTQKTEKPKKGNTLINRDQHFERITEGVWKYQIGGYQVCDKWLKDRKGQRLSLDDIKHYCRVVTAIKNTMEIQKEIAILYPEIEKEIIEFKDLKTKQ